MHLGSRAVPKERTNGVWRLHLTHENHLAIIDDRQVRGLARLTYQGLHDGLRRFDKIYAIEKTGPNPVGFHPNHPVLVRLVKLRKAMALQSRKQAMRGRRRNARLHPLQRGTLHGRQWSLEGNPPTLCLRTAI